VQGSSLKIIRQSENCVDPLPRARPVGPKRVEPPASNIYHDPRLIQVIVVHMTSEMRSSRGLAMDVALDGIRGGIDSYKRHGVTTRWLRASSCCGINSYPNQ